MKFLKNASVKAVLVLLCIALISGGLLSILNDLLYVSDEEIQSRALSKVYTKSEINTKAETLDTRYSTNANFGKVIAVHKAKDGTYVLHTQGAQGYPSGTGTVNLWLALRQDGQFDNVILGTNEGQTLISNFTAKYLTDNFVNKSIKGIFTLGAADAGNVKASVVSGATYTSQAIVNAVNMALYYGRNALKIGENPEAEAIEAVKALNSAYANYSFAGTSRYQSVQKTETVDGISVDMEYIFTSAQAAEKDNVGFIFSAGGVKIAVVANISSKKLMHAGIVGGENVAALEGKTLEELRAMSDLSGNEAAARAAAIRAVDYISNPHKAYVSAFEAAVEGDRVTYTVRGVGYGDSNSYALKVVIENNSIVSVEITQSGWTLDDHTDSVEENLAWFAGKTLTGLEDSNPFSGSTHSWTQVKRILACCLTDYSNRFGG